MRMMTEYTEAISEDFAQSEALTSYFQPFARISSMAGGVTKQSAESQMKPPCLTVSFILFTFFSCNAV